MLLSRPLFGCLLFLVLVSLLLLVHCADDSGGDETPLTKLSNSTAESDPDTGFFPKPVQGNGTEPVTTADVEGQVFTFNDGAAFGFPGEEVTLAIDTNGLLLDAVLVVGNASLSGQFFVDEANDDGDDGECRLVSDTVGLVGFSLAPVLRFNQCAIDARDRLIVRNEDTGKQSISDLLVDDNGGNIVVRP